MKILRVKDLTRSFSFRTGMMLFATILAALMTFRMLIYYESISAAYQYTQAIVDAHKHDIEDAQARYGARYAKGLIGEMLKDPPDKKLYLALKEDGRVTGNFPFWPAEEGTPAEWRVIVVPQKAENVKPLRLLIKTAPLGKKVRLAVGYDLYRLDIARAELLEDMLQNVIISLFASFLLSVVIVWLINRQFLKINRTCEAVMKGNLSRRVPVKSANDQFDRLGLNLNKMLDWITTLLDTVQESSNAVAHDMRTPLSFHRLELQALADSKDVPSPVRGKIRQALGRVDQLVSMFDSILTISKAESRSGTEIFAPFDIAGALRDALAFYAPLFEEKRLTLEEDVPPRALPFTGDEQLIKQAIVNLIDNAIKYTPEDGKISVALKSETTGAFILLTVSDNGPGIPAELREKAKDRFFRLDKSRHTPGVGLGLSLVNAVAGLHQGDLILDDNYPGLTATLRLPMPEQEQENPPD